MTLIGEGSDGKEVGEYGLGKGMINMIDYWSFVDNMIW